MKRFLTVCLAAMLMSTANSVYADRGLVYFEGWVIEQGLPFEALFGLVDESPCDFPVYVDFSWYETWKDYFNDEGELVESRWWDRQGHISYYTDPAISDVVLEEKNSIIFGTFNWTDFSIEVRGNGNHLTLPALGNVFRHTGHWVIDLVGGDLIVENGNQGTWPDGDWEPFCSALLGNP